MIVLQEPLDDSKRNISAVFEKKRQIDSQNMTKNVLSKRNG